MVVSTACTATTISSGPECSDDCIPAAHPLRGVRKLATAVLDEMSKDFDGMYATGGRPSIPPERLFRALLLQVFYSVRSERLLMEQLDYNLPFRWFAGVEIDEPVCRRQDAADRGARRGRARPSFRLKSSCEGDWAALERRFSTSA